MTTCPDHFDWPHRDSSGVYTGHDGTGRLAVPMVGRAYTVPTRGCMRCDLKMFSCDCQSRLHWLDWPDPVRKCGKCGREWWLAGHPVRTARPTLSPQDDGIEAVVGLMYTCSQRFIRGRGPGPLTIETPWPKAR